MIEIIIINVITTTRDNETYNRLNGYKDYHTAHASSNQYAYTDDPMMSYEPKQILNGGEGMFRNDIDRLKHSKRKTQLKER